MQCIKIKEVYYFKCLFLRMLETSYRGTCMPKVASHNSFKFPIIIVNAMHDTKADRAKCQDALELHNCCIALSSVHCSYICLHSTGA